MRNYFPLVLKLLLIGCFVFLPEMTFAADDEQHAEEIAGVFANLLEILSWIWIVPAVVAGKFMTNDFVYGEFIGLTTLLWKIRQTIRTFAYFVLGFTFLALIIKHIVRQEEVTKLGDTLKKTFIAGILIQMSWFLLALIIDLSLVLTAAVSSIPLEIMDDQYQSLQNHFEVPHVTIDGDTGKHATDDLSENTSNVLTLDDIAPDTDTVGGPLVFLAAGVMRLTDARFIADDRAGGSDENKNYSGIIIAGGLKLLIVIMFMAPMVVLMIINAIRIFRIWIWIIMSPFIVLDVVFNGPLQNSEQGDKFKLSSIFGLVFQPVAVIGLLSLGMIMIVGVLDAILGGEEFKRESLEQMQVYVQDNNVTRVGGGVNSESFISGEMIHGLGGHVGGFIGEMLLALLSIFLLWSLVKAGASFSAVTAEMANKGFEFAESSLKAVPLPGIGSIAAGHRAVRELKTKTKSAQQQKFNNQANDTLDPFMQKLGLGSSKERQGGIDTNQESALKNTLASGSALQDTESFWNTMHGYIEQGETLQYKGAVEGQIKNWFDSAGREYLGIDDKDATIENNDKARNFVNEMMLHGVSDITRKDYAQSNPFTEQTTWANGKRTH